MKAATTIHGFLGVETRLGGSIVLTWPHSITLPPGTTPVVWLNKEQAQALAGALLAELTRACETPREEAGA